MWLYTISYFILKIKVLLGIYRDKKITAMPYPATEDNNSINDNANDNTAADNSIFNTIIDSTDDVNSVVNNVIDSTDNSTAASENDENDDTDRLVRLDQNI